MFRIALCDDNESFLNYEKSLIDNHMMTSSLLYTIDLYTSGSELIFANSKSSYDLILLDYEMEGLSGFEIANMIRTDFDNICIAFVTVFYELSTEGYKFDAIRYLVKQDEHFESELYDCINKAIQVKNKNRSYLVIFHFVDATTTVDVRNIVYIITNAHYLSFFILEGGSVKLYRLRERLDNIANKLSDYHMFFIIKRGQMINFRYVLKVLKNGILYLGVSNSNSKLFQLADSRKDSFMIEYMRFRGQ